MELNRCKWILGAGFLLAGAALTGALVSCQFNLPAFGSTPTPTASLTPTATATFTPTPWPSNTPSPSPTATWTATPTLTPTATATAPWCQLSPTPAASAAASAATAAPSGRLRVSYLDRGNLWLWDEGGQPREVAADGDILEQRLSPDGERIAYLRSAGDAQVELWVLDGDGQNPRRLINAADFLEMRSGRRITAVQPANLAWLPGRHVLAFNTRPIFLETQVFTPDDLWLVNTDNGFVSNLLPQGQGGAFSYSPDGKTIALMTPDRLDLVDAAGLTRRPDVLPGYAAVGLGNEAYYPRPAWAADSRSFLIALPAPANAQDPTPRVEIWRVPLPGFIEELDGSVQAFPSSVSFSPDLLFSAFWRWSDPQAQNREIHLAQKPPVVTPFPSQPTPDWATATPTPAPPFVDYLYSDSAALDFIGWSPDSQAFTLWNSAQHRLYLGGICAAPVLLADDLPSLGVLAWQDPGTVLFVSGIDGHWRLWRGGPGRESQKVLDLGDQGSFEFAVLPQQ